MPSRDMTGLVKCLLNTATNLDRCRPQIVTSTSRLGLFRKYNSRKWAGNEALQSKVRMWAGPARGEKADNMNISDVIPTSKTECLVRFPPLQDAGFPHISRTYPHPGDA